MRTTRYPYGVAASVVVATLLAAGCDPPSSSADQVTHAEHSDKVAVATSSAPTPASGIALTGAVKEPRVITLAELRKLKQHTVKFKFESHMGPRESLDVGPLVKDILKQDMLAITDKKNDQVSFVVLFRAADGYSAAVSWGEITNLLADQGMIVALKHNGEKQNRPRFVAPKDAHGARQMYDLVEIRVIRLGD